MKPPKLDDEQKAIKKMASIINKQLHFTNGWSIPDDRYEEHCKAAAAKILKYLNKQMLAAVNVQKVKQETEL